MNITLFTLGTRGDVQPYALLGRELASRGHAVTLSTAKNFEHIAIENQLKFHPVDIDYKEAVTSDAGKKILKGNLFAIRKNLKTLIYPLVQKSLTEFYFLARNSDLVIYRPKTLADIFIGHLQTRAVMAVVVPAIEETSAFINPLYSAFGLPAFMNKWTYWINKYKYSFLKTPIREFCIQNGLDEEKLPDSPVPCIYGISPDFLKQPEDWPHNHTFTGFWFAGQTGKLPKKIKTFLDNGEPPLLITFGSMPLKKKFTDVILEAIKEMKQRFILVRGWGGWDTQDIDKKNVLILDEAPFENLFPKVKAVIHHGGIGTTAECLRSGKPMFVCPVLYPVGDQLFWGNLAYAKGLAVKPVPIKDLTVNLFKKRVSEMLDNPELQTNCSIMAKNINNENGLKKAADIIEKLGRTAEIFPMQQATKLVS